MTKNKNPSCAAEPPPDPPDVAVPKWRHHHAVYVLAVFSRYHVNYYRDRRVHPAKIGAGIDTWDSPDHQRAIEEGRRQLDGQFAQLQYITARASALLPVGIAMALYFLTPLNDLDNLHWAAQRAATIFLGFGAVSALWGAAVMGALIGGRSTLGMSDATLLTYEAADLDAFLARDLAKLVPAGVNTNAARLTHLGTGVAWIVLGAVAGACGLTTVQWADDDSPEPALCSEYVAAIEALIDRKPEIDLDAEFQPGRLLGEFDDCGAPSEVMERITE